MSNPHTGTSDVWAQLVANIAPLLVLVGEKHVKAYFKTMHKTSHHLLFAASPIGLVTAVTTLIRLGESPLLKRLIGRQFEPWAQVLMDVTSVSCGEVGLEWVREGGRLVSLVRDAGKLPPRPFEVSCYGGPRKRARRGMGFQGEGFGPSGGAGGGSRSVCSVCCASRWRCWLNKLKTH
ncbi:uncharacterized protein H6S33_007267 [Morchella sextelata]|uniref:uncharacterized protein n=1 Tax=Morchella sextelata TaxID=1174677 RepID=UPI001D04565D|nr:uncharacterized protein H6S33_007267 [Morchella sextelata]KAH0603608.1 hypothetical protein H6S33_007267 [Morchella sextelata]